MTKFKLPLKNSAKYPRRKTICLSAKTDNFLLMLENHKDIGIDANQFLRDAISSYIESNKDTINEQIKEMTQIRQAS